MRKTLIIFCAILVGLYFVLTFIDRSDYVIEKRLWRVGKKFEKVALDPRVVPEKEFLGIINEYRDLLKETLDSDLRPEIYAQIGQIYFLKGDYAKARENFQSILKEYSDNAILSARALFNVGNILEAEEKHEEAVNVYRKTVDLYPLTDIGLNTPFYIANYYYRVKDLEEARRAFNEAVSFYERVSDKYPQTPLGYNSLRLLFTTQVASDKWEDGLLTLERLLLEYSSEQYLNPSRADQMIKTINTIAVQQLEDSSRPIEIYQKFVEQNPGHSLNKYLEGVVEALRLLERGDSGGERKG